TSGTKAPAWRYPRRSHSNRYPSAQMTGPCSSRSSSPGPRGGTMRSLRLTSSRLSGALLQLVGVRDRDATHDPVDVVLVVAHAPEGRAVHVDGARRRAAGMADAVDVRGREVEAAAGVVLPREIGRASCRERVWRRVAGGLGE